MTQTIHYLPIIAIAVTSQVLTQEKLTISGTVKMCTDDKECLEGFGIIRREVSTTSSGGDSITFATDLAGRRSNW